MRIRATFTSRLRNDRQRAEIQGCLVALAVIARLELDIVDDEATVRDFGLGGGRFFRRALLIAVDRQQPRLASSYAPVLSRCALVCTGIDG